MIEYEDVKKFLYSYYKMYQLKKETEYYLKTGRHLYKKVCSKKTVARKIKSSIEYIEDIVSEAMGELTTVEKGAVNDLIINKKEKYIVIIENYLSEATIYRIVDKIAYIIYKKICKNRETKKTFFYIIKYLQN